MISNVGHVMTLANSIIGVGILAMPFCFQKCGILLSILLLVLNYLVTRISCHYLIKASIISRRKSIELLAFHSFGSSGKLMVELCIIGYLLGTCIAYFILVGDLGPQIVAKLLNINEDDNLRTWVMVIVTILCIIPLGMLKNVDSLSVVCTASIGFYFCLVLKVIAESENHVMANDWMEHVHYWQPSGILQCLPIFSMALSCQMQLFEVFETIPNQSLDKMNCIVKNSTRICTCVYILVGFFGYIGFCTQTFSGNILVNFSQSLGSDAIKIGFVLSVAFSFPLVIFPCRATIFSLLYRKGHVDTCTGYISEYQFKTITLFIVLLSLCLGLLIPSIEIVMGLMGSTIGVAICIMFPASCFLKISKKESTEKSLAHIILIGGFFLMILGTYANLNAIDEKNSGISTKYDQHNFEFPKHIENQKINDNISENILSKPELPIKKQSKIKSKSTFDTKTFKEKLNQNINAFKQKQNELKINNNNNIVNTEIKPKITSTNQIQPPKGNILPDNSLDLSRDKNSNNSPKNNQNSMINQEAIAKKEEVAAEEAAKTKVLQNAEKELKETKELLEKKVDELKLELAKQNLETQNLVVAKLDDIVDKVEQIEREVHEVNADDKKIHNKNKLEEKNVSIKYDNLPIISKGTENSNKDNVGENAIPKGLVKDQTGENKKQSIILSSDKEHKLENNKPLPYEPLSYKTGEIINQIHKMQNNRAALPLPLLINSTKNKVEEKLNDVVLKPITSKNLLVTEKTIEAKIEEQKAAEKENIESMRREILSVNIDSEVKIPSTGINNFISREKRDLKNKNFIIINELQKNHKNCVVPNCLNDVKSESLLSRHDIVDLKFTGRDLKSIKNK